MVIVIETYIRNILDKTFLGTNKSLEDNIGIRFNGHWQKPEVRSSRNADALI